MLLGLAVAPASRLVDFAAVGNNRRKTIDTILGAWNRVSQNGQRLVLAENISYESYRKDGSKNKAEVNINVRGKFHKVQSAWRATLALRTTFRLPCYRRWA
jgi:hypothetical protein